MESVSSTAGQDFTCCVFVVITCVIEDFGMMSYMFWVWSQITLLLWSKTKHTSSGWVYSSHVYN